LSKNKVQSFISLSDIIENVNKKIRVVKTDFFIINYTLRLTGLDFASAVGQGERIAQK